VSAILLLSKKTIGISQFTMSACPQPLEFEPNGIVFIFKHAFQTSDSSEELSKIQALPGRCFPNYEALEVEKKR
jgi:hypothetical protein